eukprot:scaffold110332_cov51-Prasinocladus_malaysianus.AAC.1
MATTVYITKIWKITASAMNSCICREREASQREMLCLPYLQRGPSPQEMMQSEMQEAGTLFSGQFAKTFLALGSPINTETV